MDKCPASKDGRCTVRYSFGVWCDGYSTSCSMRESAEWAANVAANMAESVRNLLGIIPSK